MSLRRKTLLILGITIVVMIVILFSASQLILRYRHSVRIVEDSESRRHAEQVADAVNGALEDIDNNLYVWACWDETYRFMLDGNESYIESNLESTDLEERGLDFVLLFDPDGELVYGKMMDPAEGREIPVPQDLLDQVGLWDDLAGVRHGLRARRKGVLVLPEGPLLTAAGPVLKSDGAGPARGMMVLGRNLTESELEEAFDTDQISVTFSGIDDPDTSPDVRLARSLLSTREQIVIQRLTQDVIAAYTLLRDLHGQPVLILRAEIPRTAYMQARASTARLMWLVLTVGFVLSTVLLVFLEKLVLFPLSHLSRTVSDIGKSGDLNARITLAGDDELAALGAEINRMLESLAQSKAEVVRKSDQLQTLIENQGEGVVIVDRLERFTFANPAACEIFGVEQGQLDGKKLQDFADKGGMSAIRSLRSECRKRGKCTYEFDVALPSGEKRTLLATATPRRDDKGGFIGTFEVFRDITERKRTEKLKASLTAKSEFLSMVSHELRTPLVPIIGYSELLLAGTFGDLPEEYEEPLETIYSRAEALKNLIDDILQINRMEQGTLEVRLQPLEIDAFLEEVLKPYHRIDQVKPTTIALESEKFTIIADPDRLRQVLQNLIANSMKYSGKDVRIIVRAFVQDDMGCIAVEDDGIGIREEDLPYIFERFFQVEDINTRKHEGAGLGLAIAKDLVERMGGAISTESEHGKGSVFTVSLQLAETTTGEDSFEEPSANVLTASEPDDESGPRRKPKILVIDDDVFSVKLLQKILEDEYEVQAAMSGGEGLDLVHKIGHIDLILLDWMMPGMDGLSLLVSLKADEATRDIPVIFVSGKTEPESISKGIKAGAAGFITKPYNKTEIIESIDRAIDSSRSPVHE